MTPEHQFLSESLHNSLSKFSSSSLFGVLEAQRKTFDFACILDRDFSRPLVSQVLWSNVHGIEKDLRTLLTDANSKIKVYLFRDSISARAKIEEILNSYKSSLSNRYALKGLKLIPIASEFDADKENQRNWINAYIDKYIANDLLFNIVFGKFTRQDLLTFENHGGINGLKFAMLDEISKNGLLHTPTFKKNLGYSTSGPIREGLIMLRVTGLIKSPRKNIQCFPTIKGRWLLDITKKLVFDFTYTKSWSPETKLIFDCLGLQMPAFESNFLDQIELFWHEPIYNLLYHALSCKRSFGRDLVENINPQKPIFYDANFIEETKRIFNQPDCHIINAVDFFSDHDSLLFDSDFN